MTEQKKIAVLCNYELLPDRVGGMDYFFWAFDAKCKEKGIQVDWFFPNQSLHGDYFKLHIYDCNYQSIEHCFLAFCKTNPPTYSHVITHFVALCTPFFYKLKQVSDARIIAVDHNPRPLNGYPLKKRIEKRIKGILFSRYIDVFVGVSNYTVKEIIHDFGIPVQKKVQTIYNGVVIDAICIRNHRNTQKTTFLVASHLRESKGIQDLIAAVALLPIEIKNEIRIDIYGDGYYKNNLEQKINELDLQGCFVFMGSISNLKELYSQYDYLLQPTHMECFSLSILESLAANVPVITTDVGGNKEVIADGENGYIFTAKDIHTLKDIIEMVYSGDRKIEVHTRALIENYFSLEQMVMNHLALILNNKS